VLSVVNEARFARPFEEFAEEEGGKTPTIVIEFDGCLILSILNGVETLGGGVQHRLETIITISKLFRVYYFSGGGKSCKTAWIGRSIDSGKR
jgi:hypothetical protein